MSYQQLIGLTVCQTLYIYFGVAVLVGIASGALLHHSIRFIIRAFGMDSASEERGRTLASYRAEKAERQARKARYAIQGSLLSPRLDSSFKDEHSEWSTQNRGLGTKGLLSTTILEEDDSSDAGF